MDLNKKLPLKSRLILQELLTLLLLSYVSIFLGAESAQAGTQGAIQICRDDANCVQVQNRQLYSRPTKCVSEYISPLKTKEFLSRGCAVSKQLRLRWTTQHYPNLRENPRRVQFWEGAYAKEFTTENLFLRELVDECRGKILSEKQFTISEKRKIEYDVVNPNLDLGIKESYMLLPLTETEAQQEMGEAFSRCRSEYNLVGDIQ